MLSQASLHKRGAGGAQSPLVCKHTARMVNRGGGGVSKDSYCAWRVSITTRRLSSKLAHDLKQRGVGGQPPPPHLQTPMLAWLVSKTLTCTKSAAVPRHLQTHRPLGEWRGFKKDSDSLKTPLSHFHRPHCGHRHPHLHVHLHRHHQHVYASMHECMYVYAMDVI